MRQRRSSVKRSDKIYTCIVEGEYYASTSAGKENTIKRYGIEVRLPESQMYQAMSIISNNLLGPALKKKYDDYLRYRTYEITNRFSAEDPTEEVDDPDFMNREQMVEYIDDYNFPIKPYLYPSVSELRQAIRYYREDESAFLQEQDVLEERKGPDLLMKDQLRTLNPDFDYGPI